MSKPRNKIKSTPILEETYVEDVQDDMAQTTIKEKKNNGHVQSNLRNFYKDIQQNPVYSIIFGAALLFTSIFMALSFVSFFYTWQEDFDKVSAPMSVLFSYETEVENWLGKFGALLSHIFIYKFFGIGSFTIPIFLFFAGFNKIRLKPIPFHSILHTLFWAIWLSLGLGFLFNSQYPFAGGNYADIMNAAIIHHIGKLGLILALLIAFITYFIINPDVLHWFKTDKLFSRQPIDDTASTSADITTDENSSATKLTNNNIFEKSEEEEESTIIITNEDEIKNNENVDESSVSSSDTTSNEITFNIQSSENTAAEEKTSEPKFTIEQPTTSAETSAQDSPAEEKSIDEIANQIISEQGEFNPLAELSDYVYPHLDLLNDYGSGVGKINQEELLQNKDKIIKTLRNYGIEIQEIKATIGPTVTLYEIIPAPGVRIARIKNLEDDIALSLAALGIRIIAPMPGKGTIGIEVPNQNPEIVSMKNVLSSEKFQNTNFELPVVLGKTISNEVFMADLAKMPHLLMAGATGQGKSVGINALLISLLYKKHPAELKFVLVDPKKVELTLYNKIERHFLAKLPNSEESIITDTKKVIHTLNSLTIEMDNRYALLQDAQVRNIKEYNQKFIKRRLNPNDGHRYLPYIVVVIDEFADLIMTAGKEIENPIARIAQLARAVGIHLVIATQRPSVNIITGVIKANFPARIAFRVSSKIDSRTILDTGGAEQLIGRGDMLYTAGNDLIRLQCAFVDTPEVEKVAEFIGIQRGYPHAFLLPEYVDENDNESAENIDLSDRDKLFDEAARLVVQFQQGSASFLQRKLKIGFNRAGRLVDELEKAGIVGKFEGSKQREVLIKDMQELENLLRNLGS
ncbi:MAG: DNA translocase FtsK [Bacteroidia bacterium]